MDRCVMHTAKFDFNGQTLDFDRDRRRCTKQVAPFAPQAAPQAPAGGAVQQDGFTGGAGIPAGDAAEEVAQQDD